MNDSSHPGDWLWFIACGRYVAMTPEAYEAARALGFDEAPDAWEEWRAKGGTLGEYLVNSLGVLVRSGRVRVEHRRASTNDAHELPVFALVPPGERVEPRLPLHQPQRAKRGRRKRAAPAAPPGLVLVPGGRAEVEGA